MGLLTNRKAHLFLKHIVVTIGLNPALYTLHSSRTSGASFAFDNNVELNVIQQHGHTYRTYLLLQVQFLRPLNS